MRDTVGGGEEIFRRNDVQIGIVHMKVDSLERSKQHRNMHRLSTCHRDRRVTDMVPHDASPDFGHSTSARGLSSLAQARRNMHTAAPGPWLGDPAATGHCNMQDGRAPAAQKWLQPQSHAPAATHMHTVQKSGNMALPPRKASLPPHCPPCRHPTGQSGHGRRILRAVDRHHDVEARQTTK